MVYDSVRLVPIILKLLECGQSLRAICRIEEMPTESTVREWFEQTPELTAQYARARGLGIDALAEIALEEASAPCAPQDVPAKRLAWDARRWHASKMRPDKYGDRTALDVGGQAGGAPIAITVEFVRPKV